MPKFQFPPAKGKPMPKKGGKASMGKGCPKR